MKHLTALGAALLTASGLVACTGTTQTTGTGTSTGNEPATMTPGTGTTPDMPGATTPQTNPTDPSFQPTPQQTLDYMRYIGPSLIGRVLSDDEEAQITKDNVAAVKPILRAWVAEDGFVQAMRNMMEIRLGTNGKRGAVDYNLAGYIVRHVVKNGLPWSTVLTSSTCYDANDMPIACDTGAPYTAGVLTTRGFLAGNEGRFNLGRARAMVLAFLCRDYPMEDTVQPYIDKPMLKLMFRASNAMEQQVAEVAGGFGNGLACFSCHGQFANHAQPFVKFDKSGTWIADANGLQSMTGQLGESDHDTAASHLDDPANANQEKAQWVGANIANLAEGAAALSKSPKFRECAVQQLLDVGVGLDLGFNTGTKGLFVDPTFLKDMADSVTAQNPDPTIQELAIAAYSSPRVMSATLNGLKR
jgi:hypothetical protein